MMEETGTGLYYARFRYYDSAAARFLSRDPLDASDPKAINPYQYAMGNPLALPDPMARGGRVGMREQRAVGSDLSHFIMSLPEGLARRASRQDPGSLPPLIGAIVDFLIRLQQEAQR